jgi:hypothetical protein
MTNTINIKQAHETDLSFACRNASEVIAKLREVIYVLESDRLHKSDGLVWARQALGTQTLVCDFLCDLAINANPSIKLERDKLKHENEALKALLRGMRGNIDGLLKMYPDKDEFAQGSDRKTP